MQMVFHDRAPLEKVRKLADGRIAAVAKFARSGCYQYAGHEVGRPAIPTVTVYRPESEVFDQAAMASFAHKAITIGHPSQGVTADNWKEHSVGWTEGKVARDGEFVEIPLMLADASAVRAYESGEARELSAGYSCDLVWGDGIAPDGTKYRATQKTLRGNHIALVPAGRAGSQCRIGDSMHHAVQDAEVRAVVAREEMIHQSRFAWMGDQAPPFDEERATFLARVAQDAQPGKLVRDAARDEQWSMSAASDARAAMIADLTNPTAARDAAFEDLKARDANAWRGANGAAVRDLARDCRYR